MITVERDNFVLAFEFVSSVGLMEHQAFISMDTGKIYWISDDNPLDEELPDDLGTSGRYIPIPHKNDLELGRNLVLDFAAAEVPNHYAMIQSFFRRRGAYGRFKEFLATMGKLDKWYEFEAASTEKALKEWCAENDIELVETNKDLSA